MINEFFIIKGFELWEKKILKGYHKLVKLTLN